MNKQEATEYILRQLDGGYSPAEIAQQLSQQLKAPVNVVEHFVAQVAAQPRPAQPAQQEAAAHEAAQVTTPQADPLPEQAYPVYVPPPEAPIQTPATAPKAYPAPSPTSKNRDLLDDPELAKTVWSMLRKGRKRSDVTMWVCEKTGVEWTLAQRFVAEVQVEHHGGITNIKLLQIIGSAAFVLGGFVLVLIGLSSIAPLVRGLTGVNLDVPIVGENTYFGADNSLGIIILGIGLMIGGFVGAYLAFQSMQ
jgi:hypothetical protein